MELPPYSPDLNPIENLWNHLKRRVEKRNARNTEELEQYIKEEWVATDPGFLVKLSHSMNKRCKQVVEHKGHRTTF